MAGGSYPRRDAAEERYARIMGKADAIQARQRRKDERFSLVLSATSLATLVTVISLGLVVLSTNISGEVFSAITAVMSIVPGVVTLIMRVKDRD
ncbi:hypothetical protein [Streptomyces sp. NPDC002215]|uniref:hypothetical protein n=1 Tax=Streptomyces sp. NPDC002215 TaxID=3154412 RepID=UPI0033233E77